MVVNACYIKEKMTIENKDPASYISNATFFPNDNNMVLYGKSDGTQVYLKKIRTHDKLKVKQDSRVDKIFTMGDTAE